MATLAGSVFRCAALGGCCAAIVYFIERTYSQPLLAEDVTAYFVAAASVICLAIALEFE